MTAEMTLEEVERLEAEVRRLKRALADGHASISAVARAYAETKGGEVGDDINYFAALADGLESPEIVKESIEDIVLYSGHWLPDDFRKAVTLLTAKEAEIAELRDAIKLALNETGAIPGKTGNVEAQYHAERASGYLRAALGKGSDHV